MESSVPPALLGPSPQAASDFSRCQRALLATGCQPPSQCQAPLPHAAPQALNTELLHVLPRGIPSAGHCPAPWCQPCEWGAERQRARAGPGYSSLPFTGPCQLQMERRRRESCSPQVCSAPYKLPCCVTCCLHLSLFQLSPSYSHPSSFCCSPYTASRATSLLPDGCLEEAGEAR